MRCGVQLDDSTVLWAAPGTGSTGVHEQGFRPAVTRTRLAGHLPVIAYAGGDGSAQREAARRLRAEASGDA